jgi:hypothetical protein
MPGIDLDDRATLLRFLFDDSEPNRIESPSFDGGEPYPGVNPECNADVPDRMDAAV